MHRIDKNMIIASITSILETVCMEYKLPSYCKETRYSVQYIASAYPKIFGLINNYESPIYLKRDSHELSSYS